MKLESKAIHTGERKRPGRFIPVTTPIYTSATYVYEDIADLDKIFGHEMEGPSYGRYDNPTTTALEETLTALENGAGTLVCGSGMMALNMAIQAALNDRRRSVVAASALYGATISLLMNVLEPSGVAVTFVDFNNLEALANAVEEAKPGCLVMETVSNPLLRVAEIDKIAKIANDAGAALVVDNTFATPLICRPLELGAHMVAHSLTKYLSGHGDVLAGAVTSDEGHLSILQSTSRIIGPILGPFESFLVLRGLKTFVLRMERQCRNARDVVKWLQSDARIAKINFPGNPDHADFAIAKRLFSCGLSGAVTSFEIAAAGGKPGILRFMNALKMIVPATSVGDVHSMLLYPAMSSHREISSKHRARLGITDDMVRLSVGIEAAEDIIGDIDQALGAM
jgi:cystathionine beta-lyase/cystathionine gamma-synthase